MQGELSPPSRLLNSSSRALVDDTYAVVGADEPIPPGNVIVPLARLLGAQFSESEQAGGKPLHRGKLGVQLQPSDDVRQLAGKLDGVSLVALTFTKHTEGRPYSQARILREQLGFTGDVRAVGAVVRDHLFFMHRCGINEFLLRNVEETPDAADALDTFSVYYQPAAVGAATAR